jgi:shikimate dehydrogenase
MLPRALCLSLPSRSVVEAAAAAAAAPGGVTLLELRLDRLDPAEVASGAWASLAAEGERSWVLTWRSPGEGGMRPRPAGVLRRAVEAGFAAVDVEAGALDSGDEEAAGVPVERRWVSRHDPEPPRDPADLRARWDAVRRHPAALHKLVVPAERFEVNAWILDLVREDRERGVAPGTVFAQGWIGHPSRVLGHAGGNAVTFLAPGEDDAVAPGQPSLDRALRIYDLPDLDANRPLFGVLGSAVRASRSPELHNRAFRAHGIRALYLPLESPDAGPVVSWMREGRLSGLSVTSPFKEEAARLADRLEPEAEATGAVNTLRRDGDTLVGSNTDVLAARRILGELDLDRGAPLAVLGAGGGAAAVLSAAREHGLAATVFNRDPVRGKRTASRGGAAWGGDLDVLDPGAFPALVNATPLGVAAPIPESLTARSWARTTIVDLGYRRRPTGWEELARRDGSPFRGGLEFLVRQGIEQFALWTGVRPDPVRFALGLGGAR